MEELIDKQKKQLKNVLKNKRVDLELKEQRLKRKEGEFAVGPGDYQQNQLDIAHNKAKSAKLDKAKRFNTPNNHQWL